MIKTFITIIVLTPPWNQKLYPWDHVIYDFGQGVPAPFKYLFTFNH